ncbi:hypothetical protein [Brevundimonas aurifodinae]|uniref:DNA-binding protein n=1 Tax=Brevundimonas aurifodinae TaxID=1508312 RepID=A0ABV1NJX9_9CAUL
MTPDQHDAGSAVERDDDLLTRNQASEFLQRFGIRMKPTTLARAWSVGNGPPCRHIRGKPLYPRGVLRDWAEAQDSGLRRASWERPADERRAP